jgi:TRAP-type C4-dicarboxylate transport system permease small subunit
MERIFNFAAGRAALDRISALTSNLAMIVACAFILLMMFHVTLDVLGKYLFAVPAPATIEAVQFYYMVALVFLPFAYIARGEGHIYVELFTRRLAPRTQQFLDGVMGILTLAWVGAIAIYAGGEAITTTIDGEFQETAEGVVAVWPSRWFVPLGSGIMALAVVVKIVENFQVFGDNNVNKSSTG